MKPAPPYSSVIFTEWIKISVGVFAAIEDEGL